MDIHRKPFENIVYLLYNHNTSQIDEEGKKLSTNTESDGRFHSNWLNMMYPRLKLARNLLTDDGIVFISIDDNEIHNLRKLCDEIFGEVNFQGLVSRVTGTPTGGGNKAIVNEVDFVLIYSKTEKGLIEGAPLTAEEEKIYDREDGKGTYLIRSLRRTGGEDRREDRPSMYYPVIAPNGSEVFPIGPTGYESRWICGKEKYQELLDQGLIHWQETEKDGLKKWQVYQKFYLEGRLKQPSNLWKNIEGNKKATRDVKKLFDNKKVFDFPKPVELVTYMLRLASNKNSLILDFFAGSGTTAHSIIQLNSEDGGSRKFICIQLPEPLDENSEAFRAGYSNIADICKERIRRIGAKIEEELKLKIESENNNSTPKLSFENEDDNKIFTATDLLENLDTGFKEFKLDSSNIHAWDGSVENFEQNLYSAQNNIKENRTEEDVLYEILLKYGLDLTVSIKEKEVNGCKIYSIGGGVLFVCLSDNITTNVADIIGKWKEELQPTTCQALFKDNGFKDDIAKTNSIQILRQYGIEEVNSI